MKKSSYLIIVIGVILLRTRSLALALPTHPAQETPQPLAKPKRFGLLLTGSIGGPRHTWLCR